MKTAPVSAPGGARPNKWAKRILLGCVGLLALMIAGVMLLPDESRNPAPAQVEQTAPPPFAYTADEKEADRRFYCRELGAAMWRGKHPPTLDEEMRASIEQSRRRDEDRRELARRFDLTLAQIDGLRDETIREIGHGENCSASEVPD